MVVVVIVGCWLYAFVYVLVVVVGCWLYALVYVVVVGVVTSCRSTKLSVKLPFPIMPLPDSVVDVVVSVVVVLVVVVTFAAGAWIRPAMLTKLSLVLIAVLAALSEAFLAISADFPMEYAWRATGTKMEATSLK